MLQYHSLPKMVLFFLSICQMPLNCENEHIMKNNINFDTQYNQFYLADNKSLKRTDDINFWSTEAHEDRLAMGSGIVGVGTECYGNIKAEIEILDTPNTNIDYSKYDHIVEGGINIQSGELQVLDCPDSHIELSLKVQPGKYRVRIYSSNLASVKETDLSSNTDNDYYRIEIWKSDDLDRKVLKQYPSL